MTISIIIFFTEVMMKRFDKHPEAIETYLNMANKNREQYDAISSRDS